MDKNQPTDPNEESLSRKQYEAPSIEEVKEMIFPEEVWKEFSNGKWCFGCSNCNCN